MRRPIPGRFCEAADGATALLAAFGQRWIGAWCVTLISLWSWIIWNYGEKVSEGAARDGTAASPAVELMVGSAVIGVTLLGWIAAAWRWPSREQVAQGMGCARRSELAIVLLLPALSCAGARAWSTSMALDAAAVVRANGAVLVGALMSYEARHGHPPDQLSDLVPSQLSAIPAPGIRSSGRFFYWFPRALTSASCTHEYDLGGADGEDGEAAGAGMREAGSYLRVEFDEHRRVSAAEVIGTDSAHEVAGIRPFDSFEWSRRRETRAAHAHGLVASSRLLGARATDVFDLLRRADAVDCKEPRWEVFAFLPVQRRGGKVFYWTEDRYSLHPKADGLLEVGDWMIERATYPRRW